MLDLKDSPYKNSSAKNGFDSVSAGKVELKTVPECGYRTYPYCKEHGAMSKVDVTGLWRCFVCNAGAFIEK